MTETCARKANSEVVAIKRALSKGLQDRLRQRGGTVSSLARELGTSRTAVQRALDPKNTSITLRTMVRAANSLGYRLLLKMEPQVSRIERIDAPGEMLPLMEELGEAVDRLPS